MTTAIQLNHVTARYREKPVLQDISLTIEAGEMIGILGPNGAGKSTLFAILSGLLAPASGTVEVFGAPIQRMAPEARARRLPWFPRISTSRWPTRSRRLS